MIQSRLGRSGRRRRSNVGLLFVLPACAVFILYVAWPLISMVRDSLYDWDGISPDREFVGLRNYIDILTRDRAFRTSVLNNLQWAVITVAVLGVLGFSFAYILSQPLRLRNLYRTAFFLPVAASAVVIGFVWKFIYDARIGPLNEGLRAIGQEDLIRTWLADPAITLYAVMAVAIWASLGFYLVVYLAAIQSIPRELFESASLDGANGLQKMRHIALPLTGPTTRALVVLGLIWAINQFGFVFLLSQGGPYHASEVVAYQIYDLAFSLNRTGYAAALSFILVLVSLVITLPQLRSIRRQAGG